MAGSSTTRVCLPGRPILHPQSSDACGAEWGPYCRKTSSKPANGCICRKSPFRSVGITVSGSQGTLVAEQILEQILEQNKK